MLRTFIGVALVPVALMWGPGLADAVVAGLQMAGWFHLPPISRLVLALSVPLLLLVFLTVTWPRLRRPARPCVHRIAPADYDDQKSAYTVQALAALRRSNEYEQFRRAVDAGRVVSAFEGDSDGSFSGEDE